MPTQAPSPEGRFDGFTRFVTLLRWITTLVGLVWAALAPWDTGVVISAGVLLVYALYRTFRPLEYSSTGWQQFSAVLLELVIALTAVIITGTWQSPLIFILFTPVVAAGFSRGQNHALRIAATAAIALGLSSAITRSGGGVGPVITWTGELLLIAVVASYGRTLLSRAEAASVMQESQSQQLAQANALLADLDRLARDLSVSFDFQDTVRSAVIRIRHDVPSDIAVLLLAVPETDRWDVALAEGVRLPDFLSSDDLPTPVRRLLAAENDETVTHKAGVVIHDAELRGFSEHSTTAVYVPLKVGPRLIGVLAIERSNQTPFNDSEARTVRALAKPTALSVDNARWFERLQARGAARERTRIARDLHDRLGQSIAYIAFELDRLTDLATNTELADELGGLRDNARAMVRELRETLSDLRTDVTDDDGLVTTITGFLDRVQQRSGLETIVESDVDHRIGLGQEREIWRIAQEAITNVERHADATKLIVRWSVDRTTACLEIEDDGIGITRTAEPAVSLGRPSYGITGMRERASLLGAALDIEAVEPAGTKVRLCVSATAYASSFLAVDESEEVS